MKNTGSYEEEANMAVQFLKEFVHLENQLVTDNHSIEQKLYSLDYLIAHLDESIPKGADHLHELNGFVYDEILELRKFIEKNHINDLKIVKDNNKSLSKLKENVEHREWVALKKELDNAGSTLKKFVRLEKHELKELHRRIINLMKIMKRSKLIKALEEDLKIEKERDDFEKKEEYYFTQIYKFLRAYERIFRHLWRKERILLRKISKINQLSS